MDLIFEMSKPGKKGYSLPARDLPKADLAEKFRRRRPADLPEVIETEIVRHLVKI
jgi:glycine dehydrogenase subunit 2